jgi:hypothetical protein
MLKRNNMPNPLSLNAPSKLSKLGFVWDELNGYYTLEVKNRFSFAKDLLERKLDINAVKVMVSDAILSDTRINLANKFKIHPDILRNL